MILTFDDKPIPDIKSGPKKTSGRRHEIIAKYQSGVAMRDVGAMFGISHQRVQQILKAEGIEERHNCGVERGLARVRRNRAAAICEQFEEGRRLQKEQERQRVVDLYMDGVTYREMSLQSGLAVSRIIQIITASGSPRRNMQRKTYKRLAPGQKEEIRRRRLAGETGKDLAREFGVSEAHVYTIGNGGTNRAWPKKADREQRIVDDLGFTVEKKARAKALFAEGYLIPEIAAELRIPRGAISMHVYDITKK